MASAPPPAQTTGETPPEDLAEAAEPEADRDAAFTTTGSPHDGQRTFFPLALSGARNSLAQPPHRTRIAMPCPYLEPTTIRREISMAH
jgi:hypothetical protein